MTTKYHRNSIEVAVVTSPYGHDFLYKRLFRVHPSKNAVATRTSANILTSIASIASIHALASRHSPQAAAHLAWVRRV
jgi:hypothetical protein